MSSLSSHVLDAVLGEPARGLAVELLRAHAGGWEHLAAGRTDADGRIAGLGASDGAGAGEGAAGVGPGHYRLVFATGDYFSTTGGSGFYPEVVISFAVGEERHYHVPLLLSPYAYSTYRGS